MNLNMQVGAGSAKPYLNPQNSESDSGSCLFTIEGNIGCGKSTFLKILQEYFDDVKLIEEPVPQWQNVGGKGLNILDHYYKDPKRWGLTFLNFAVFTRVKKWKEFERKHPTSVKITERSILADRHVFGELMRDLGFIDEAEYAVHREMYKGYSDILDRQSPMIIYLRCEPEVCYARTKKRCRNEEEEIPLDYLKRIHEKHQNWIKLEKPDNVLLLDTTEDFEHHPDKIQEMVSKLRQFLKKNNKN